MKPFYFQWHFLKKCNLRCIHCYQDNCSYNELPESDTFYIAHHLQYVLEKWKRIGRISLTGGEPFANKELLFKLIDFFERSPQFYWIGILTNGTYLTEEDIRYLKRYSKLKEIQVSLDGGNKYVHELIRGYNTFYKAINGIKLLKKYNIYTTVMFTLMKLNLHHINNIIDLSNNLGVDALTIERIVPTNFFSKENLSLNKEDVYIAYKQIYEKKNEIEKNKLTLKIRTSRPLWGLLYKNDRGGGSCPVGFSCLSILHDGTVLPCRRLEIPIGNILNDGLFKIWYTSTFLWKMRNKNLLEGSCRTCSCLTNCGGCRAIAYAYSGNSFGEDPHCFKEKIE